MKIGAL